VGGDMASTGVDEAWVACRGLRWPRKKPETHLGANNEMALAA